MVHLEIVQIRCFQRTHTEFLVTKNNLDYPPDHENIAQNYENSKCFSSTQCFLMSYSREFLVNLSEVII